jgi:GT2 family glycosyltransferase
MIERSSTWAVIVSWNVASVLRNCLESLQQSHPWPEIVVVDNASEDGTCEMVRAEFADVHLIANDENVGFARGSNQGVRKALELGASRILLINPDASLEPGTLATLEKALEKPEVGLVAPTILDADGKPQAYAYGGDPTLGYLLRRGSWRLFRNAALHDWGSETELNPDWVTGACVLARARIFQDGLWFDEKFFLYFEDNDWCLRLRQAGWRIERVPEVRVRHFGGVSLARNPAASTAYGESLRYFYSKHYPRWQGCLLRGALAFYGLACRLRQRS